MKANYSRIALAWLVTTLILTACGGGGGSGSITASISATATTTAQSLTVGRAMNSLSPLTASGGATPYIYSYAGTLPAGLNLNTSTGAVAGTPTATYTTANVVFSVQDANGVVASTTSTVSFVVGAASVNISATATTTSQNLTIGTAMTSFSPLAPSGGVAPYTYSHSGTLPAGLNLNTSTGAVTGNPTATYTTANVVFSVQDANGVVASTTSTVIFTVVAAPVSITATAITTSQNLTIGTAMTSFSPLAPSGGVRPYAYSITTGTLPLGISLNYSTGAVTGTPTATYTTANVVFSVQDANGVVASTTSTVRFAVISATATTTAQNLYVGMAMPGLSPIAPSGGATPYTYSYTGTLPSGLSLDTSTGTVTGTPTATYTTANVGFSVQDANGVVASTTSTVSFTVLALPTGYLLEGGLIWMPSTSMTSMPDCSSTILNQTGWRLPTEVELLAFYAVYPNNSSVLIGQGWTLGWTWSSTYDPNLPGAKYVVNLSSGGIASYGAATAYMTCVY